MAQQDISRERYDDTEPDEDAVELAPRIQRLIGERLQQHYDDLVQAPIPDTIMLLLAELEAKEAENGR